MELTYNIEQEVTATQFKHALTYFTGFIAHRKTSDKFFIKPMTVKRRILQIMSNDLNTLVC